MERLPQNLNPTRSTCDVMCASVLLSRLTAPHQRRHVAARQRCMVVQISHPVFGVVERTLVYCRCMQNIRCREAHHEDVSYPELESTVVRLFGALLTVDQVELPGL